MTLQVCFLHKKAFAPSHITSFYVWRKLYIAPIQFMFHFVQFIVVLLIFSTIILKSTNNIYSLRTMYLENLFPDNDVLFFTKEKLQETIDGFVNNLNDFSLNSFQHFYFKDESNFVTYTLKWLNGSETISNSINLSSELFRHMESFNLMSEFYVSNNDSEITGCTKWNAELNIKVKKGSYLFVLEPSLKRNNCPKDINLSFFSKDKIKLAFDIKRRGFYFLFISLLFLIFSLYNLFKSFKKHQDLLKINPKYADLDTYEQFHSSIGFWKILNAISNILSSLSAFFLIRNSYTMTQFLSLTSFVLFGFSGLFISATAIQWINFLPKCYVVALVIRQSFTKLCSLIALLSPIIFGLLFIVLFLFGFVMPLSQDIIKLIELLISVIFGDSVLTFYDLTTDQTDTYNYLSFIFSSITTAILIWVFYTFFTAQVIFIYEDSVTKLLHR